MKIRQVLKNILPKSLFGRSLLILIMPILLVQIFTTYMFFDRHWTKMTMRLSYAVAGEISMVADMIETAAPNKSSAALENAIGLAAQSLDFLVSYRKGAALPVDRPTRRHEIWDFFIGDVLAHQLDIQLRRPFLLDVDLKEHWVRVQVQLKGGVLSVTLPQKRLFSSTGYIVLLWMFAASLMLSVIAILFMRNQIRPIKKLAAASERFGKGRDVAAFRPQGAREVRMAGEAFLDMQSRIRRQMEQRAAMLAGVSHDLRTPLTRLKLQLAVMPENADTAAMKDDIQDMEKMIAGYLDFVRGAGDEEMSHIEIVPFLKAVQERVARQGIAVDLEIASDIVLPVRVLAFERCLMNLIGNAGRYASQIRLSVNQEGDMAVFLIDDNGPGIPESLYEDVFKPFYRADSSRNADTGGVGLGLPIALDIVHGHGGHLWLDRSPMAGLRVAIALPL